MDESPVNMIIDDDPLVPPIRRRRALKTVSDHLPISPLGVLSSPEDSTWLLNRLEPTKMRFTGPATNHAEPIQTLPNKFGILRCYFDMPTSTPDDDVMLPELINPIELPLADSEGRQDNSKTTQILFDESISMKDQILNIIYPHPNFSTFLMNVWFY